MCLPLHSLVWESVRGEKSAGAWWLALAWMLKGIRVNASEIPCPFSSHRAHVPTAGRKGHGRREGWPGTRTRDSPGISFQSVL